MEEYCDFVACRQFDDYLRRRSERKPFAAFVGIYAPHPPRYRRASTPTSTPPPRSRCRRSRTHSQDLKLNFYADDASELYDLAEDPGEIVNRYDDPACRNRPQELLEEIARS